MRKKDDKSSRTEIRGEVVLPWTSPEPSLLSRGNNYHRSLYIDSSMESRWAQKVLQLAKLRYAPCIVPDNTKYTLFDTPEPPTLITPIGRFSGLESIMEYALTPVLHDLGHSDVKEN